MCIVNIIFNVIYQHENGEMLQYSTEEWTNNQTGPQTGAES